MTNFRRMRFDVTNEAESELIQKHLFELGYSWNSSKPASVDNLDKKFLFAELNGDIKCSDTLALEWRDSYTKMCIKVTYELCECDNLIKLNGVLYSPKELEAILQNHKERAAV